MTILKQINKILTNKTISFVFEACLILYTVFIVPHMLQPTEQYTKTIINLFNNSLFKLFILSIIGYLLQINLRLGLFLLIAWSVTNDVINKYTTSRKILRLINGENKLREIKLEKLFQPVKQNIKVTRNISPKIISPKIISPNQKEESFKSLSSNTHKILMDEVDKTIINEIKIDNFVENFVENADQIEKEINGISYIPKFATINF